MFVIIGGDVNVQIGKDKNNEFGLHNLPNRNDEYLADFSLENSLSWLSTKSPHPKKRRENTNLH